MINLNTFILEIVLIVYLISIFVMLFYVRLADNTDLLILSCNYSIQWKECSCLKGIRLEDVTVELEEEAYEEMRNNK